MQHTTEPPDKTIATTPRALRPVKGGSGAKLRRTGKPVKLKGPFWIKSTFGEKPISGMYDTLGKAVCAIVTNFSNHEDIVIENADQVIDPHDPSVQKLYDIRLPLEITKEIALAAGHRQEFYHRTQRNKDGTARRARVNGKCQTWVSKPNDWRLPMKAGLKDTFQLGTSSACHQTPEAWLTIDPTTL